MKSTRGCWLSIWTRCGWRSSTRRCGGGSRHLGGLGLCYSHELWQDQTASIDSSRIPPSHLYQSRLTTRTREVEGEAHLRAVAERGTGRLRSDAARLAARRAELAQRVTAMETEAFTAGERLDHFRLVQNWNQVGGWLLLALGRAGVGAAAGGACSCRADAVLTLMAARHVL